MVKKLFSTAALLAALLPASAGGILTNTNQNVAFNRMMSREASIGIDGVYSNPAGVAFMKDGSHFSLNAQMAWQTRTTRNTYPLFQGNTAFGGSAERQFEGEAFVPVLPSIQYAYNHKGWSYQASFAVSGGGGRCQYDDGLGSFEKLVAETAAGVSQLAGGIDQVAAMMGQPTHLTQMFGTDGKYSYNSDMRGRQYYFGLQLGAAHKFNDHIAAYAGLRFVYALCNYYGHIQNITVGQTPLYKVLDASKTNAADIRLNSDQTGFGVTPVVGIDYKTGRFNFSARYEFRTALRLDTEAANATPSVGNLPNNLVAAGVPMAVLQTPAITGALTALGKEFDTKLTAATEEYADGTKVASDIPALLTIGAGYKPIDALRVNVGFHYFFDRQAHSGVIRYDADGNKLGCGERVVVNQPVLGPDGAPLVGADGQPEMQQTVSYVSRTKKLSRGTVEVNAGAEYDLNKRLTVSAGWQNTSYGLTPEYMSDRSYVVSSNSLGCGVLIHATKKIDVNLAYFCTLYKHMNTTESVELQGHTLDYTTDYHRTNHVIGVGVDFNI